MRYGLSIVLGILLSTWLPGYGDGATRIVPALLPLVLVVLLYRRTRTADFGICLICVLAAPLRMPDSLFANASLPEGLIDEKPRVLSFQTQKELSFHRYIVQLKGTEAVRLVCRWPGLEAGQSYFVWGRVLPYPAKRSPWDFDQEAYGRLQGAHGIIRIDSVLRTDSPAVAPFPDPGEWLGSRVDELSRIPWQRELLRAFLLGQGQGVSPETRTKFNRAGLGHVLAVSGLHTGIVFAVLSLSLSPLRRWFPYPHLPGLLALIPLSLYGWLTGGRPSVTRAILMCGAWVVARHSGRHTQGYAIWSLALFASLLFRPSSLFNLGFQLSFSAVLAIIWGHNWLSSRLGNRASEPVNRYLIRPAWFTLCAQAGTLPLSLYYFGLFPWLFLPANLIVLPALPLLIGLGMLGTVLAMSGLIFEEYVRLTEFLLSLLDRFLAIFQHPPSFLLTEHHLSPFEVGLAYAALITIAAVLETRGRRFTWILLLFAVLGCARNLHRPEIHRIWITHEFRGGRLWMQRGPAFSGTKDSLGHEKYRRAWMQRQGLVYRPALPDRNVYDLQRGRFLVALDSSHWVMPPALAAEVLWLRENSPVHLDQLLEPCQVGRVVADGSNYTSTVDRWERSCTVYGIPFHRTDRDGYFEWDLNGR